MASEALNVQAVTEVGDSFYLSAARARAFYLAVLAREWNGVSSQTTAQRHAGKCGRELHGSFDSQQGIASRYMTSVARGGCPARIREYVSSRSARLTNLGRA